ncbi:hypothetical protein OUZ56_005280 [Daphnia magna]|uniref:Uncharacterized protein n=1 Tax=Daphnia magna TaxID=35525 RepID=A0ABQ9YSK3_9CRUS|nr:hypothetical protein OUZ56_005280 [Daphnia magna]
MYERLTSILDTWDEAVAGVVLDFVAPRVTVGCYLAFQDLDFCVWSGLFVRIHFYCFTMGEEGSGLK